MTTEKLKRKKSSGFMILTVMFVVFVAFIGISILGHTITHTRILRSRLKKIEETSSITQETIRHLHSFHEKIFSEQHSSLFSPDEHYFNTEHFPDVKSEHLVIKNNFNFQNENFPFYQKIRVTNTVYASSTLSNRLIKSGTVIDILSGKIPLSLIPFFVLKKIETTGDNYLKENQIDITGAYNPVIDEISIDFNISDFLIDSLKINGEILSWEKLREKFGLEISEEPIEEGIYFITEENTIESLFIQGDVQKMIFSVDNDFQKVEFYIRDQVYELGYIPDEPYFFCWDPLVENYFQFNEKIIVNGNLWSLEQKNGLPAFREDSSIVLMVSGQTVIRTSLETRNLELKKLMLNNLTLVCSHHALFDPEDTPPRIIIESENQINIQASFLVNGIIENRSPEMILHGSLFAKDILNQGQMRINPAKPSNDTGQYFRTVNFTFISGFLVDFIEEIPDA